MAHGIGGVKAAGLAPFAERFAAGGFAALVFDYRHWGGSTGEPRQLFSIRRQLEDYRTVLAWTHAHDGSMSTRIFVWGTSFSGMHIVELRRASQGWPAPSRNARWWTALPESRRSRCLADFG